MKQIFALKVFRLRTSNTWYVDTSSLVFFLKIISISHYFRIDFFVDGFEQTSINNY